MSKSYMMEGKWKDKANLLIHEILKNKHISIFSIFFIIVLIFNCYVISAIGPTNYIDSFKNPHSYYSGAVKKISNNGIIFNQKCIIQKTSHPDFSFSEKDEMCIININGNYQAISITSIYNSFQNESFNNVACFEKLYLKNQEKIIGKIISYQNNNPLEELSFSYWMLCKDILNIENLLNQKNEK